MPVSPLPSGMEPCSSFEGVVQTISGPESTLLANAAETPSQRLSKYDRSFFIIISFLIIL